MATLSVTIPAAITQRVLDAVCYNNGYVDTVSDAGTGKEIPNPVSKAVFAKQYIKDLIVANVVTYERHIAAQQADLDAAAKAKAEITILD